jgi:hypothetical protein
LRSRWNTSRTRVRELFPESIIVTKISIPEAFAALGDECNAIGGDSTDVLSLVVVNTSAYQLVTNRFS